MRNILTTLFIFLFCLAANAQSNLYDDYVVTWDNDTIFGEIKSSSKSTYCQRVILSENGKKKQKYFPDNIKQYKKDSAKYISTGDLFLELKIEGTVSLFEYHFLNTIATGAGTISPGVIVYEDTEFYIYMNNAFFEMRGLGFRKNCESMFADYPEVLDKIRNKDLKYRDLPEIVNLINSQVVEAEFMVAESKVSNTSLPKGILLKNPVINFKDGSRLTVNSYSADSLDYYEGEIYYSTLLKSKNKSIPKEDIYSIMEKDGSENVLYKSNLEIGEFLTPDQMRHYVLGLRDAKGYRVSPLVISSSFLVGFGGSILPQPKLNLGDGSAGVPAGLLIPITYVGIMGATVPSDEKLQSKNPDFSKDENYLMGLQEGIRKKRLKQSIIGSALGIVSGFIFISAIN